jgi:hypothetical protein
LNVQSLDFFTREGFQPRFLQQLPQIRTVSVQQKNVVTFEDVARLGEFLNKAVLAILDTRGQKRQRLVLFLRLSDFEDGDAVLGGPL